MQGAQRGTRSRDPRIRPWAEGGAKPLGHPGCPITLILKVEQASLEAFILNSRKSYPFSGSLVAPGPPTQ